MRGLVREALAGQRLAFAPSACVDSSYPSCYPHGMGFRRMPWAAVRRIACESHRSVRLTLALPRARRRAQFGACCLVGDQAHPAAQQILEEELHAEVSRRGRRPVERDQDVHIAVGMRRIADHRSEERETSHPPYRWASSALLAASCCSTCARYMLVSSALSFADTRAQPFALSAISTSAGIPRLLCRRRIMASVSGRLRLSTS